MTEDDPDLVTVVVRSRHTVGWACPNCHGMGHMCDGSFGIDPGGFTRHRAPSPCPVCRGKGRVLVTPLPDVEFLS